MNWCRRKWVDGGRWGGGRSWTLRRILVNDELDESMWQVKAVEEVRLGKMGYTLSSAASVSYIHVRKYSWYRNFKGKISCAPGTQVMGRDILVQSKMRTEVTTQLMNLAIRLKSENRSKGSQAWQTKQIPMPVLEYYWHWFELFPRVRFCFFQVRW